MIYFLWKHKQVDSNFAFIPENELPLLGFRSVYGVDKPTADAMMQTGTYSGFKGVVHPTDYLIIDIDDTAKVESALNRLQLMGLEHSVWDTGNRGCHIYIKRSIQPSQHVPAVDKEWVKTHFPEADLKLYTHLHLIRQIGAIHEKTGNKKVHRSNHAGSTLFLEYAPTTKAVPEKISNITSVFSNTNIIELSMPHYSGSRRKYITRLAVELAKTNNPWEFTYMWLVNVNMIGDELADDDLRRIVDWAYAEVASGA